MERIILVRHGQTSVNTKGLLHIKGDEDSLNELGVEQMNKVAEKLKEFSPNKVYTSQEKRAGESGQIIANRLGVPLETVDGIEERNFGDFSGGTWEKVAKILDPMTLEERYTYLPPNGESWKQFEERLIKALDKILSENENKAIVVVTHAGVVRALMPHLLGVEREDTFKYNPDNASITIFDHDKGKFQKVTLNDTTHLN